jgi:putative transcriptional regulator
MKTKKKKLSRLTEALLETAADMHKSGIMNDANYDKITLRHLGKEKIPPAKLEPLR